MSTRLQHFLVSLKLLKEKQTEKQMDNKKELKEINVSRIKETSIFINSVKETDTRAYSQLICLAKVKKP